MFNWFWNFLYSISEILYELVDGLLSIANKLCGVEPIKIDGKETDFMTTLLTNKTIDYAFMGATFVAIFLLMVFSVIAICKNAKDNKKSPTQIAVHVFKTLGMFLMIPAVMIIFTILVNKLVVVMFTATRGGYTSLGEFLFYSFMPDGFMETGGIDWHSVKDVRANMSIQGFGLSEYRFFFSWLVCIPLLFCIAKALLMFVDRTISIVILFIFSPISMSTSVIDDGQRFKMWREQVLTKYISGFGMIIAINIYCLVLGIITSPSVEFFDSWFLNFLLKIAFCLGGAFFLPKVFGLVGNLFVQGGGDKEFNDAEHAFNNMKQVAKDLKRDIKEHNREKKQKDKEKKEKEKKAGQLLSGSGNHNTKQPGGMLSSIGNMVKSGLQTAGKYMLKKVGIDFGKGDGNDEQGNNEGGNNDEGNNEESENNEESNENHNPMAEVIKKAGTGVKDLISGDKK